MAIHRLEIHHFRNLEEVLIQPHPGLNFIIGPNGSGKTSLLEAVHCLGRGKSFRTHKTDRLISENHASFTVVGQLQQQGHQTTIGIQRQKGASLIRLNGRNVTQASQLTDAMPITVLEPGLHRLIEEGPEQRRKFLDWGVFHVKHEFQTVWAIYRRALAQRNASLRAGWTQSGIANWDRELASVAEQLTQIRQNYLTELLDFIPVFTQQLSDISQTEIRFYQGWREGMNYLDYLKEQFQSDKERGFTQFGPHRADLRIRSHRFDAKDYLSRGQQKMLVASLILAQCKHMQSCATAPIILVDDLPSELDSRKATILLQSLRDTGSQVFITATDESSIPLDMNNHTVFHVEHGRLTAKQKN